VFLFDETSDKLELCAIGSYHTAAILSLDYMTFDGTVLICSGSSDGRIFIAEIATLLHSLTTADVTKSKDVLKLNSIYSTTAHQVGVNCIKFIQSSSGSTHDLVSAGDDQKLYTMRFSLSSHNGESQIHCLHTFEIRIAQNAAITGTGTLLAALLNEKLQLLLLMPNSSSLVVLINDFISGRDRMMAQQQ
jgi:WD40 repeat protein